MRFGRALMAAASAACLAAMGLSIWWLTNRPSWLDGSLRFALMTLVWVVFAAGIWLVLRLPRRAAVSLILLGGIGLPLAASYAPPNSSDDLYRYIWDGRVQSAGVNPYQHVPADAELVPLRDEFLWPAQSNWCVAPGGLHPSGCTLINRPAEPTIYPPVAQAYFAVVHELSPSGSREKPIQLAAAFIAAALAMLLVFGLPKLGLDPRLAVVWAWCPLVALEAGNNAHVDVVAAFLGAGALIAVGLKRSWLGGVLLGLAVAVKLTPALLGPSLVRRRPWAFIIAGAAVVGAVYLPHVINAGPRILGYLPGYLHDEGYSSGGRFSLLSMVMPDAATPFAAGILMAATVALLWWRSDVDRPWSAAIVTVGVALLIATPPYSWYALLLVMLVAFDGGFEWLTIAVAGYVAQFAHDLQLLGLDAQRLGYGGAALVIGAAALWRWLSQRNVGAGPSRSGARTP